MFIYIYKVTGTPTHQHNTKSSRKTSLPGGTVYKAILTQEPNNNTGKEEDNNKPSLRRRYEIYTQ